jgi:hypothetical protein
VVRPGITGWAQINGGNLVTTEEKGALDDWYVHNASFWLDLRIAFYTLIFFFHPRTSIRTSRARGYAPATDQRPCQNARRAQARRHSRNKCGASSIIANDSGQRSSASGPTPARRLARLSGYLEINAVQVASSYPQSH